MKHLLATLIYFSTAHAMHISQTLAQEAERIEALLLTKVADLDTFVADKDGRFPITARPINPQEAIRIAGSEWSLLHVDQESADPHAPTDPATLFWQECAKRNEVPYFIMRLAIHEEQDQLNQIVFREYLRRQIYQLPESTELEKLGHAINSAPPDTVLFDYCEFVNYLCNTAHAIVTYLKQQYAIEISYQNMNTLYCDTPED